MLSATFFRSKFDSLFYMIRMLRSPLPRTMEWLPATIHEHIVCQVPETNRTWELRGEPVPLRQADLKAYRQIIEAFRRKQINTGEANGRKLCTDLECFLRRAYEGRDGKAAYEMTSVLAEACANQCTKLLSQGRRPLVFADTQHEAEHLISVLGAPKHGLNAMSWSRVQTEKVANSGASAERGKSGGTSGGKGGKGGTSGKGGEGGKGGKGVGRRVIVAVKTVEGQGINMQYDADAIICRPTPGDHLEQVSTRPVRRLEYVGSST
jgi:uncharacterized membrane protein YgcG